MAVVTTRRNGDAITPATKPFSWSYSKLKNYEICPKRMLETDILKNVSEDDEDNENLRWGDRVHKTAAAFLKDNTPLPDDTRAILSPWMDRLTGSNDPIFVEQKYAITADLAPCTFFAKDAWFRGVADVVKVRGPAALAIDWKTGKILEDSVQLALMAQCVFAHMPAIQKIRTEFIWLKEDASSREDFTRADMPLLWRNLLPRVERMKSSHTTQEYLPKPGKMCAKYCGVTTCQHHGKRY